MSLLSFVNGNRPSKSGAARWPKSLLREDRVQIRKPSSKSLWPIFKKRHPKAPQPIEITVAPSTTSSTVEDRLRTGWQVVGLDTGSHVGEDLGVTTNSTDVRQDRSAELAHEHQQMWENDVPAADNSNVHDRMDEHSVEEAASDRPPVVTHSLIRPSIVPVLQMMHRTHQEVMQRTLVVNDTRAPLSKSLAGLMCSLDSFMNDMARYLGNTSLSEDFTQRFGILFNHNFKSIQNEQYATFRAADDAYSEHANALVQVLWRSSRYLDKVMESNTLDPTDTIPTDDFSESQSDTEHLVDDTHQSPELLRYLSQTGDVDAIHEKLVDLTFDRHQLLSERDSRALLGLSLDEESLAFLVSFDLQYQSLLDELHNAEGVLLLMRQRLTDDDVRKLSGEPSSAPRRTEDYTLEDDNLTPWPPQLEESNLHSRAFAYPQLEHSPTRMADFVHGPMGTPLDPTDFINAWLLNELQSAPDRWAYFSATLDRFGIPDLDAEELHRYIVSCWPSDIPAAELGERRRFADQQSMVQNEAVSQHFERRSTAMIISNQVSVPLLQLSSTVTARDIMDHASRARQAAAARPTMA